VKDGLAASAQIGDRYYLPRDLNALAELEAIQGRAREAEASYRRAEAIVEGMLSRAPGRYAEASLLSVVAEIYAGHFRVAAALGDTEEAYRVLERIRGRSTVDTLLRRPTGGSVGCQDSGYEQKIAAVQVQLMQAADRDRRTALLNDLLEAEVELDYHCELDYGTGNLRAEPASLEELRRVLRPDELLLEYVLNNDASFCLRVTRESAGIVTLPASSKLLDNLVKTYLANVASGTNSEAEAKELYHVLLQEALGSGEKMRLVISADGALSFVPFEGLVRADGRYTLSDHVVSYVPSGTFLWLVRSAPRAQAPRRFLGIGGVAYTQVASSSAGRTLYRGLYDLAEVLRLEDLPSTGDEVLAAAHTLGDESHVLLGARATETTFKSEPLKDFEVIHLAVHAIEDPRFPERAGLVLGRDADSKDDGLLQLREIANLRLNDNLVVLSACGAARGKIEGEEGVENLVRVFLAAGARAVIASLWNADDDYTAALMKHFYEHLAGDEDAASSLRLAKLEMLSTFGNHAEPYYWAGFTLTGDGVQWLPQPK
jgi:CHAT domain-containing protein